MTGDEDRLAGAGAELYRGRYRMAVVLHVAGIEYPHGGDVVLAALHAQGHEVHQAEGGIGGGGKSPVEEGEDLFIALAEDEGVIHIGCHALETVGEDFDDGADVLVHVEGAQAMLLPLTNEAGLVGSRGPCGLGCGYCSRRRATGLAGLLVEGLCLGADFDGLAYGFLYVVGTEVNVGNGGEEPFDNEQVDGVVLGPCFAGLGCVEGYPLEGVEQQVLQCGHFRLLAAYT